MYRKNIIKSADYDKLIYLATLGITSIDDDIIRNTARIILATIHDKINAKTFITHLSMHTLTNERTFYITKEVYNDLYENSDKPNDDIGCTIHDFAISVSDKLLKIITTELSSSQMIYDVIYRSILLFKDDTDVTTFIEIVTSHVNDIRVSEYCRICGKHLQYSAPSIPKRNFISRNVKL